MNSAAGRRLTNDIERLANSLNLPQPVSRPTLVALIGLPGTGKSFFSSKLSERLPFVVLESDALRKLLFYPPSYSPEESVYLFQVIHHLIRRLLDRKISIILDATNLAERGRKTLYRIAEEAGANMLLVQLKAPETIIHRRLTRRHADATYSGYSDATWEIYRNMVPRVETIRRKHFTVDSSQDITPVLDEIVKEINGHS